MKASGKIEFIELSEKQREDWRRALLPVHKEMESRVGKELVDAMHKEAEALGVK